MHTTTVRSRDTDETDNEFLAASSSLLCQKGDKSNMVTFVKAQAYSIAQAIQADIVSGNKVYSDLSYDAQRSVDFYNQNATAPQRTKHAVAVQVFREWPFRLRQMMDSDAGHASCLSPLKSIPPRVYHYRLSHAVLFVVPLIFWIFSLMNPRGYYYMVLLLRFPSHRFSTTGPFVSFMTCPRGHIIVLSFLHFRYVRFPFDVPPGVHHCPIVWFVFLLCAPSRTLPPYLY